MSASDSVALWQLAERRRAPPPGDEVLLRQQSLCLRHFPCSGGRPPSAGCSGPLGSCSMPPDHPATVRFPGGSAAGAGDSGEISPELEKINVQKEKKNKYIKKKLLASSMLLLISDSFLGRIQIVVASTQENTLVLNKARNQ